MDYDSRYFQYKRTFFIISIKLLALFAIIGKFFYLQIFSLKSYRKIAEGNSTRLIYFLNKRGKILDRNDKILAESFKYKKIIFIKTVKSWQNLISNVFKITNRQNENIESLIKRIDKKLKQNRHQAFTILKYLTRREIRRINFYQSNLPGISINEGIGRKYSLNNACHTIGIVNRPESYSKDYNKILLNDEDFKVGKTGIEKIMENKLKDKPGEKLLFTNSNGVIVSNSLLKKGEIGKNVKTTLDYNLQEYLGTLMEGKEGSAILMKVDTGEVLAIQSAPIFNPNEIVLKLNIDELSEGTFMNKSLCSNFSPGSIFKIISGMAALENNLDPKFTLNCNGSYRIGNRVFKCHKEHGHGRVDFKSAISKSCNCYFYHLSKYYINFDQLWECGNKLSFGKKTGIELEGERTPIFYNTNSFYERFGHRPTGGDLTNSTIGQGFTSATPIQLATMIARIASGKEVYPSIFKENNFLSLPFDEKNLNTMRAALFDVFNEPESTLYHLRSKNNLIKLAGKSGTAQAVSKNFTKEEIRAGLVKYKDRAHSLFTGYGPFEDPKYAIAVVIEHGGWGSVGASPIGINMLKKAIELNI